MILQGNLEINYNEESYVLMVKTFLKHGVYYFFVTDKEKGKSLLGKETLELIYTNSFCANDEAGKIDNTKIPGEIISTITKVLLENKKLWFY